MNGLDATGQRPWWCWTSPSSSCNDVNSNGSSNGLPPAARPPPAVCRQFQHRKQAAVNHGKQQSPATSTDPRKPPDCASINTSMIVTRDWHTRHAPTSSDRPTSHQETIAPSSSLGHLGPAWSSFTHEKPSTTMTSTSLTGTITALDSGQRLRQRQQPALLGQVPLAPRTSHESSRLPDQDAAFTTGRPSD